MTFDTEPAMHLEALCIFLMVLPSPETFRQNAQSTRPTSPQTVSHSTKLPAGSKPLISSLLTCHMSLLLLVLFDTFCTYVCMQLHWEYVVANRAQCCTIEAGHLTLTSYVPRFVRRRSYPCFAPGGCHRGNMLRSAGQH